MREIAYSPPIYRLKLGLDWLVVYGLRETTLSVIGVVLVALGSIETSKLVFAL